MSALFFLACAAVGAFAGFLGGLLGIGGGVVMVPALLLLSDALGVFPSQPMLYALGTSLAVIVFTSLSAARAQVRAGKVRWDIARRWAPGLVLGALAASSVAVAVPGWSMRAFVGLFLLGVACVMLTRWQPHPTRTLPGVFGAAVMSSGAGLVSGMAGIGGGNVIVPTLVYHNVPIHNATATSSALGVPVALAGALGYAAYGGWTPVSLGYVHLPAAVALALTAVIFAPLGVRVAHRLDANRLKRYFGMLLIVVALRMLWSSAL
ncbi:MAG: sulfite exporter TauE/SafE family protein [Pseudomonadota bacterium]